MYEFEVTDWGKPVAYQYINDAGWENYGESIAIKADKLEPNRACLEKLVPIIQQASVDYLADPAETNDVILAAVDGVRQLLDVQPGDRRVRRADDDRRRPPRQRPRRHAGQLRHGPGQRPDREGHPGLHALGQAPPDGLTAEDVVTNEFIDENIGL